MGSRNSQLVKSVSDLGPPGLCLWCFKIFKDVLASGDTSVFSSHLHIYSQLPPVLTIPVSWGRHRAGTPSSISPALPSFTHRIQSPTDSTSVAPNLVPSHHHLSCAHLGCPCHLPLWALEQLLGVKIQITLSPDTTFWVSPKHPWEVGVNPAGSLLHIFLKRLSPTGYLQDPIALWWSSGLLHILFRLPEAASRLALGQPSYLFPRWVPPSD